ncbi:MAG: VWA domain-containing protein, partial [Lachnospiraceae bacterium]|nr:VWA domain-containing protein [Lachnospiraceae bacterium]
SVKISLTGKQVNTLSVNRFNNDFLFPEDMPGYIGGAYDFKVEGEFDQATLCFEFDESLLDEENFDPVIYYFDEEEQWLYELETTVEGNVATAVTTHFSKYILINRMAFQNVFFDCWSQPDKVPIKLVMVIDDSGTLGGRYGYDKEKGVFLGGTDPAHKRLEIAKNIVNGAEADAVINIIKADNNFDRTYAKDYRDLTVCDEKGKKWLVDELDYTNFEWCIDNPYWTFRWHRNKKQFDSCGGKYLCYTCFGALENFLGSSDDPTINKDYARVMLIISDGQVDDYDVNSEAEGKGYAYIKKRANQMGVQIVTIGLGSDENSFNKYLKPLSTATNGKFYYAKDLENVDNIYEYIKKDLGRDIKIDSDSDGIPDVYEDGLLMFNGKSIKLDKNNPDTDGDGLLDGEEVELEYRYYVDTTKVMVIGGLKSNPLNPDSDGDGEGDATDPTPLRHQLNEELCKKICELNYISREYIESSSDLNTNNSHIGKEWYDEWYTFMFIRQFNSNYIGGNWDKVAGAIDYNFVEYVKNNNYDLYNYFETHADYIAEKTGKKGDLYHLAATMTAFYYWSNYDNGTGVIETAEYQFMPDGFLDELAGWAGDLQTSMVDAIFAVGENADYNTYKEAMIDLIAYEDKDKVHEKYPGLKVLKEKHTDIHFGLDDLFADVDAENILKFIGQESSLEEGLNTYFCSGYKKRFNEFTIDFLSKKTFTKWVDIYTKERFIFNKWPLYVDPDKNKVPIPKELSEAARDVFVEYIWERVDE